MANLIESNIWEDGIYQIETTDPVSGGDDGIDNKPHKSLANRTAYLKQKLEELQALVIPTGVVNWFAMSTEPTGWLKCNGNAVSRSTYANLFTAIGTTFGAGDGSTTFNLPDLRGEFVRGWDDGRGIDSGRDIGSSQLDAFQGHNRTIGSGAGSPNPTAYIGQVGSQIQAGGGDFFLTDDAAGGVTQAIAYVTTDYLDGGNGTPRIASETRPRNIALLACIKY